MVDDGRIIDLLCEVLQTLLLLLLVGLRRRVAREARDDDKPKI